jgi:hypothetical protein
VPSITLARFLVVTRLAITPYLILARAIINAVIPKTIRVTSFLSLKFPLGSMVCKQLEAGLG